MALAKDIAITSIDTPSSSLRRRLLAADDTIIINYEVKVKRASRTNDVKARMEAGEFLEELKSDISSATNVDLGKLKVVAKTPKVEEYVAPVHIECLNNCTNRGTCDYSKGKCTCNTGYFGKGCERMLNIDCPHDCSGHGRCQQTLTDGPSICHCSPGYSGIDCSEGRCLNDCSGRGTCLTKPDLYCQCNFGFVGADCSRKVCPNDCSGHGYCNNGVCTCLAGYSGYDCAKGACPSDCHGHGVCQHHKCHCDAGFGGQDCAKEVCGPDCMHGECIDNKCICFKGFVGRDCDTRTCGGDMVLDPEFASSKTRKATKPLCSGNGICSVDHRCECDFGFTGEICEFRACPGNCSAHGVCLNGTCLCADGYVGNMCQDKLCHAECEKHGVYVPRCCSRQSEYQKLEHRKKLGLCHF